MTDSTGKLAEALAAFQAEMPIVAKAHTATVPMKAGGKYSYTYADLADVSAAAMPILAAHGLSFSAAPELTERGFALRGMLLHTSGESLTGLLPISGSTPQEMGSSLTYMRRYLLGCMTGIVTDDDDDGGNVAQKAATRKQATPKLAAAPANDANPFHDEPPDLRHPEPGDKPMTAKTRGQLFALFGQKGVPDDQQLSGVNHLNGTAHESRSQITEQEAKAVIEVLKKRPDAGDPA